MIFLFSIFCFWRDRHISIMSFHLLRLRISSCAASFASPLGRRRDGDVTVIHGYYGRLSFVKGCRVHIIECMDEERCHVVHDASRAFSRSTENKKMFAHRTKTTIHEDAMRWAELWPTLASLVQSNRSSITEAPLGGLLSSIQVTRKAYWTRNTSSKNDACIRRLDPDFWMGGTNPPIHNTYLSLDECISCKPTLGTSMSL